ncbi:YgfZ/GcvT domain-containing protein [Conexibacter woesei]|uniref:CAF17-like 4Fe-4S cluster assembly/insertion protein YgfZ n=1 Tax=Conexibacter woesei TaxID=191495 RepID=UPI0003F786FF|nr:glycine cleavage T C-terminal barrel domain-containing protein [Conexibacter woesei]
MATIDAVESAYETLRTGVGLVDRSEAGKLLLVGPQAREFLDGQVSNAVAELAAGSGVYATLLTNKGRMLGDLRALAVDDASLLLITERPALQALFDQTRRGLIGWQAELHKRTLELGLLSLIGPQADAVAAAAGLPVPGPEEHATVAFPAAGGATGAAATTADDDASLGAAPPVLTAAVVPPGLEPSAAVVGVVVRTSEGLDVLPAAADVAAVRAALLGAGAVEVPEAAAEIVRVESGRPRYGIDLDDGVMPEEAGIVDRAVSFRKGCYVGQETVARLHWKGKPNRHLRGLRLSAPSEPGTPVLSGDREVGHLASSVTSPHLGPIALAILRREVSPGDHVTVAGTDAEVVTTPFA